MIKLLKQKYALFSKDGSKKLGEFSSKEAAEKRERQVKFFKALKGRKDARRIK